MGYRYDSNENDVVKKSGPYYSEYFSYVLNEGSKDELLHTFECDGVENGVHYESEKQLDMPLDSATPESGENNNK